MKKREKENLTVLLFLLLFLATALILLFFSFRHNFFSRRVSITEDRNSPAQSSTVLNPKNPLGSKTIVPNNLQGDIYDKEEISLPSVVGTPESLKTNFVQVNVGVLRARSGPGISFPIVRRLIKGMIVQIDSNIKREDETWYRVKQPYVHYPGRINGPWFVAGQYKGEWYVKPVMKQMTPVVVFSNTKVDDKWIKVSLSKQKLWALEGGRVVLETLISSGVKGHETPTGEFHIVSKYISRYMQGPFPGVNEYFDLPGIPFVMYFTNSGNALHGTYWHHNFGHPMSHGCVNLPIRESELLYRWAEKGTLVKIVE